MKVELVETRHGYTKPKIIVERETQGGVCPVCKTGRIVSSGISAWRCTVGNYTQFGGKDNHSYDLLFHLSDENETNEFGEVSP